MQNVRIEETYALWKTRVSQSGVRAMSEICVSWRVAYCTSFGGGKPYSHGNMHSKEACLGHAAPVS